MRSSKNFVIVALVLMFLCMSTVYIAVAEPIEITSSARKVTKKAAWNVKIVDIDVVSISGKTVYTDPVFTATSCTLSHNFTSYGDSITYKVRIKNNGTLDAKLDFNSLFLVVGKQGDVKVNNGSPKTVLKKGEETEFVIGFTNVNSVNTVPFLNSYKGVFAYKQN